MASSFFRFTVLFFLSFFIYVYAADTCSSAAETLQRTGNGVIVQSSAQSTKVEVCSDRVIHIVEYATFTPTQSPVPVVIRPCAGATFKTSSDQLGLHVLTRELRVDILKGTGEVHFSTRNGDTVLSEQTDDGVIDGGADNTSPKSGTKQTFLLSPQEALYGLGQHQDGILNIRGVPIRLLQANSDIAIPFLISTEGYGLLWNNPSLTDFDPPTQTVQLDRTGRGTFRTGPAGEYGFLLSGNYRQKLLLSVGDHCIIDLKNMWLPKSAGATIHLAANTSYNIVAESGGDTTLGVRFPSKTMTFRSDVGSAVDYYFIYGPLPRTIVAEYRDLTGSAPLLPKWAYGFWQCRERYSNQQQLLDAAAEFRNKKIPVDVLVQDWQYWGRYGWNAMRFDERSYPDPKEMMTELHRQDLHLVISVWAKFGAETAVDHQFEDDHLLLTDPASTGEPGEAKEAENWADLFNPKAQELFWDDINHNLFSLGLDGWWLDASEPEGDPLKGDDTFLGPGKVVRNAYPLYETSAVYEGQRAASPSKRVVILSRSAFSGQQRNGSISWSGDISANWETLRRQIAAGLGFAMSGFPYWTTDIGGFFRPVDQYTSPDYHELLIRWFQFGTFCPIFRIHGFHSQTEMWNYGPQVEKILAKYDALRYRLLPYIYSSAWGVTSRGEIMMRALPFDYPKDSSLRDISDEFFFGDSVLVNPVTVPHATSRPLLLPAGDNWVDFWTGRTYRGGETIVADAPLDRVPILIREGSIIPMGPVVQSTAELQDPLEIRVYGGRDADFLLYNDAGDSYAYEQGARATIPLHWDNRLKTLSIGNRLGKFPGIHTRRTFQLVLVKGMHGVGIGAELHPDRIVTYNGHAMTVRLAGKIRP